MPWVHCWRNHLDFFSSQDLLCRVIFWVSTGFNQRVKKWKPAKQGALILRMPPQVKRQRTIQGFDLSSYLGRITMIPLTRAIDVCGVLACCRGEFVATQAPLMSFICFVLSPSTSYHLSTQSNDEGGVILVRNQPSPHLHGANYLTLLRIIS